MPDQAEPAPTPVPAPRTVRLPLLRVRLTVAVVSLSIGAAIWLPSVHLLYRPADVAYGEPAGREWADRLAARHLTQWSYPGAREKELARMRSANAEWDFMGRSFLVWALANLALAEPDRRGDLLPVMDRIIDETLRIERERGMHHFLMPYARRKPFVVQPARSLFVDGEIALMLGLRRLVEEKDAYRPLMADRIEVIVRRMEAGPVLCAESYPDECWTFCNAVALAAVRVADHLDGTDHRDLFRRWVQTAQARLVDRQTGLLVSSFTLDGRVRDGPEGSSIWMVAHCLQLVDEALARDQYERARRLLGREVLGFGYGREWPSRTAGHEDVDSGPVVPLLEVSAGSSGLAFVGARSFGDAGFYQSLRTTLDFAGFPIEDRGRLRYAASNQVGDAVLLYSAVLGPAWDRVKAGARDEP